LDDFWKIGHEFERIFPKNLILNSEMGVFKGKTILEPCERGTGSIEARHLQNNFVFLLFCNW